MVEKATSLERESLVIRGVRSELTLEGGRITIVKEATTQASPTRVEFDVRTVRATTLDVPRRGGRGWLHVACANGSPSPVGELAASGDPYTLPITSRNVGACRKLARMVDKHVKERGLPGDVGPNQGRFTSGVVVSSGVKAVVAAPMVTVPDAEPAAAEPAAVEPAPPRKKAVRKKAAKKPTARKAAAKKATGRTAAAKKATAGKAAAKRPKASNGPATGDDRVAEATALVGQLRELGELHAAGVLDDAEFAAAKAKILG